MDGILSQARKAAEDAAYYHVYCPRVTAQDITAFVLNLSKNYIWQRDAFALIESDTAGLFHGTTRVGDCIQDEWYIVWLLMMVTNHFEGSVACISDADGQFLLIEAADVLPKWVTPTNADNRVWFYQGILHLVPLQFSTERPASLSLDEEETLGREATAYIDMKSAIQAVIEHPNQTLAPSAFQSAISSKVQGYPQQVDKEHLHKAIAYLPDEIIHILSQQPSLISKAVTTFYERDPVQLKYCATMAKFSPSASARPQTVQMTRTLYAQIVQQKFYPPKPFERATWFKHVSEGSLDWKRRDLGMKITCGFEMLYQDTKSSLSTNKVFLNGTSKDSQTYKAFLTNLSELGYFKNELAGSSLYKQLERQAYEQFVEMQARSSKQRPTFAQTIQTLLEGYSDESISKEVQGDSVEDSDKWMQMDPDSLDAVLEKTAGQKRKADDSEADEDEQLSKQAEKLGGFADQLEGFLQGKGSLNGAMFDDELSDEEDDSDEEAPTMSKEEKEQRMAKLVPSLPATEWGQDNAEAAKSTSAPDSGKDKISKPTGEFFTSSEPKLEPEKYDGVSDDDSDQDDQGGQIEELEDDDPAVEGEEIDMDQEMDDFLRFTREALGLSEAQYNDILKSRSDRGAFVPSKKVKPARQANAMDLDSDDDDQTSANLPAKHVQPGRVNYSTALPTRPAAPVRNAKLDSFEALMDAMDAELRKTRGANLSNSSQATNGLRTQEEDEDEEMEAELLSLLEKAPEDLEDTGKAGFIKNLLASVSSQQGAAGPVTNLAGRLNPGLSFPEDKD